MSEFDRDIIEYNRDKDYPPDVGTSYIERMAVEFMDGYSYAHMPKNTYEMMIDDWRNSI